MAEKTWEISGEYMESCNCDHLCPCIYAGLQGPVTYEHCTLALDLYPFGKGNHGHFAAFAGSALTRGRPV